MNSSSNANTLIKHNLWPHQVQAVDTIWAGLNTKPAQLCVLPTGSGKSTIITETMCKLEAVNYPSLLLLNREILVTQFAKDLPALTTGFYAASVGEKNDTAPITVAMIQSCYKHKFPRVKVIMVDEAHNMGEDGMYAEFLAANPQARVVGFSATPYNKNGYIFGKDKFFPRKDFFRSLEAMIAAGRLVRPRSTVPITEQFDTSRLKVSGEDFLVEDLNILLSDKKKARAQVNDALRRLVDRKKILWMCLNVEHAQMVQAEIESYERCAIIHSKLTKAQKESYRAEFEQGRCRHMVSVMMITEGYDYKPADALVMLRPTRSAKLYVQSVGRVLRISPGKADAVILDYGEIIKNLGSVYDPHVEQTAKKKAAEENLTGIFFASKERVCAGCFAVCPLEAMVCHECGHEMDKRLVDQHLQAKAAAEDIEKHGREMKITGVTLEQYEAKSGNLCVRVNYSSGIFYVAQYYTAHPFSWSQGRRAIKNLTGWDFETFQECYDNVSELVVERVPTSIMIKKDGRYDKITKVNFPKTENAL